jgi:hypothetical protein
MTQRREGRRKSVVNATRFTANWIRVNANGVGAPRRTMPGVIILRYHVPNHPKTRYEPNLAMVKLFFITEPRPPINAMIEATVPNNTITRPAKLSAPIPSGFE